MSELIRLGRTEIKANKNGFGALPIQRVTRDTAGKILNRAYDQGITLFDTARAYSDSEEKLGYALHEKRNHIVITTKSMTSNGKKLNSDLEQSLKMLQTDYIDIYQIHNPSFCPKPGGEDGIYDAMLKAKAAGKIRFIGITNHNYQIAQEAIDSGLYDTLQFPFSYLSTDIEHQLIEQCKQRDMGFIAMKALAGGLLNHADACYAYMNQYDTVLPIWGIQKMEELEEFIRYERQDLHLSKELQEYIDEDQKKMMGDFCRGCGYCMPCPAGIEIPTCARMSLLLRRAVSEDWLTEEWQKKMKKIEKCIQCGACKGKCPYHLDTPNLLKRNYDDYKKVIAGEIRV